MRATFISAFVVAFAAILLVPVTRPATSLRPAILPGYWCGTGKAPVGKEITIKGRRLTFVSGKMNFILSSENGEATGDLKADIRLRYEDKTSKDPEVEAELRYIGYFEITGSAREPKLTGSWQVKGAFVVTTNGKSQSFPYKAMLKAKSWLGIDSASLELALGTWANSTWKWKATRVQSMKAGYRC